MPNPVTSAAVAAIAMWFVMATVGLAASATPPAQASLPRFGIGPIGNFPKGYFVLSLKPGETKDLVVAVVNAGDVPADLELFAANAVNPANGGFAAADQSMSPIGATSWLSLRQEPFTLSPRARRSVAFTVNVPAGTPPGQYITALVASTVKPLPVPGGSAFMQILRSTLPVEIDVPGPVKAAFRLGQPQFVQHTAGATLDIPIANTGNILVKPAGTLTITAADGKVALTTPVTLMSVYAGLSTHIELNLPAGFAPGNYRVSLSLKDPATGATASIRNAKVALAPPAA